MAFSSYFKRFALVLVLVSGASAARAQSAMLPLPDPSFVPRSTGYDLGATVNNDQFRKADQYIDSPQLDADGVRHFANGRHFDLSKTPLEDAVAQTNASTLGPKPKPKRQNMFANNNGRGIVFGGGNGNFDNGNFQNNNLQNRGNFQNRGNNFQNVGNNFQNGGYNNGFNSNYNNYNSNNYGARQFSNYNNSNRQGHAYVTDWGPSEVSAMNNQNYRSQQNFYRNTRRQYRNPRWNWD